MDIEREAKAEDQPADEELPVCASCFTPFDAGTNYCTSCGSTVGQHTEYVPFVNIRWQADGFGRLMRESSASRPGVFGKIIQILVTLLLTPLLLFGLPFKWAAERRKAREDRESA